MGKNQHVTPHKNGGWQVKGKNRSVSTERIIAYGMHLRLKNRELSIDIKNRFAYNNIRRKACFSSGLTLKSDMLVNHVIDRWRTTLKSDIFTSTQLVVGRQH